MFEFKIADFVPYKNKEVLERVRKMSGEELTCHSNPEFKIKIVSAPAMIWVSDMVARIVKSDLLHEKCVMILPNPCPVIYESVAAEINRLRINCRNVHVYTMDEWNKITKRLNNLPFTKKDARSFMRFFLSGATAAEFDKQGRINITSPLVTYADLKKECVIIGVGDRLEIWSLEKWNSFYDVNKDSLSDIAETLFDSNWQDGE